MKELINQIALQKVKGIGPSTIRKLTADFNSTEAVFRATKNDFKSKYKVSGEKIYQLIFNNEAHLLDSTESLINMMGLTKKKSTLLSEKIPNMEKLDLQLQERKLLKQLYQKPNSDYDFLTTQLKISIEQLQSLLTSLEIKGHIELLFGKKIKIIT